MHNVKMTRQQTSENGGAVVVKYQKDGNEYTMHAVYDIVDNYLVFKCTPEFVDDVIGMVNESNSD
jgi:hypothetical protein